MERQLAGLQASVREARALATRPPHKPLMRKVKSRMRKAALSFVPACFTAERPKLSSTYLLSNGQIAKISEVAFSEIHTYVEEVRC